MHIVHAKIQNAAVKQLCGYVAMKFLGLQPVKMNGAKCRATTESQAGSAIPAALIKRKQVIG